MQGILNMVSAARAEETLGMTRVSGRGICGGGEVGEVGEAERKCDDGGNEGGLQKYKTASLNHL